MAHGTKFSLLARIAHAQRALSQILDSLWFSLVSVFSKRGAPSIERKPTQHTGDRQPQRTLRESATTFVKSHRLLLEILGLPLAFVTVSAFYLSYLVPKLSVDSTASLIPYNPMGTVFYLSNDGTMPMHDIAVTMGNFTATGEHLVIDGRFAGESPPARAKILSPGHKMTLPFPGAIGFTAINNLTGARMTIRVYYRPEWIPWHKTQIFPFEAVRSTDGSWVWRSIPQ